MPCTVSYRYIYTYRYIHTYIHIYIYIYIYIVMYMYNIYIMFTYLYIKYISYNIMLIYNVIHIMIFNFYVFKSKIFNYLNCNIIHQTLNLYYTHKHFLRVPKHKFFACTTVQIIVCINTFIHSNFGLNYIFYHPVHICN